jgi:FMN hydrolase / 5-amino-6-(5-phospho-D-ribitylamino)uracil phosphatase
MITPLLGFFKHEYAFLSEDIRAYKQDEQGRFFKHILQTTGVNPQKVIHVGDGLADILGAKRAGISSCWVNRENIEWTHPIKPDYIIQSLAELESIIS